MGYRGVREAYLRALVEYFGQVVDADEKGSGEGSVMLKWGVEEWAVVFRLRSLGDEEVRGLEGLYERKLVPLTVVRVLEASNNPAFLGFPRGACVISANKNVGFGPSGT
jgi:poly(ADP-ribose) glycohydrolase